MNIILYLVIGFTAGVVTMLGLAEMVIRYNEKEKDENI